MIRNKAADRGASLRYDTHELPFLTLWKNTGCREDGYVDGDRAGHQLSQQPADRAQARPGSQPVAGRQPFHDDRFAVHAGADEVGKVAREIARIQGDRRPLINEKPEKKE